MANFPANWPAPDNVRTVLTDRVGGFSQPPFGGLNLGFHVGDNQRHVERNWQLLTNTVLPRQPLILKQVHGNRLVELQDGMPEPLSLEADGSFTRLCNAPCAVLTADCLPVLLCDRRGSQVAALHAGWRGLAAGIISNGVATFSQPGELLAYIGPGICGKCFEVGSDVLEEFISRAAEGILGDVAKVAIESCFIPSGKNHWHADLFKLAKLNLRGLGVERVFSHNHCSLENKRFYSYRREGVTGRFASIIWLADR